MTTRRDFLMGAAGIALAPSQLPHDGHGSGAGASDRPGTVPAGHSGVNGASFRSGAGVDTVANGFDPAAILREFDPGTVSVTADGRTRREWTILAQDKEIEVAPGVRFPAWTFNGRVPGPTLRCTEGDELRIRFVNDSAHPHTMHFHGIHPADMDGVPMVGRGVISPGEEFTYTFDAEPFGLHLYHCHVGPLAEHIARGMYGTFIVDPR
jgi:FtsP/CotA-like multicopper oxidase with cupredoxin domain